MNALSRLIAAALSAAALAACHTPPAETPMPEQPAAGNCAVIESSDWAAWINAMPGPGAQRTLIVTGRIMLPTPGYTITLREGPADRSANPVQQLILDLAPPGGMVSQVITTAEVRYEGPAIAQTYRGVRVMCAGAAIADITEVQTAH